jgi:hypothetical protein
MAKKRAFFLQEDGTVSGKIELKSLPRTDPLASMGGSTGEKKSVFGVILYWNWSFYQDRLGTNIGKADPLASMRGSTGTTFSSSFPMFVPSLSW